MAKIENYNGSPAIMIDGKAYPPMLATVAGNFDGVVKVDKEYYRRLGEAGIRIFFLICDTVWLVPDALEKFRKEAEILLSAVPDAYIIPRIGLHPPIEWIESHPDDVMRYSDMKDRPIGLMTESYKVHLRNMYSLCSENWRRDAGKALSETCDLIEALPYADRIIGYFLAAGGTSEWYHYFDRTIKAEDNIYFDVSPAFRKEFKKYLDKKYGEGKKEPVIPDGISRFYQFDVDRLIPIYGGGTRTYEPKPIPPSNGTNRGAFLDVDKHMQTADFVLAWSEGVANSIIYFADIIKKRSEEKLVGAFYGALSMFHNAGNVLGTQTILKSGKVDFLSAPGSYENRQPGGSTGQRFAQDSPRLFNAMYIAEDDTRTHMENGYLANMYGCFTPEDTENVLKREFGRNICDDVQSWWFDQHHGGGRYKTEACYSLIERQQKIAKYAYGLDRRKNSEIACIYDMESMAVSSHQTCTESIKVMRNYELSCIGAPCDYYFTEDLPLMPDYKLYIFFNAYFLSDAKRKMILEKLRKNHATALWLYAPGIINPDKTPRFNPAYMEDITGIKMGMIEDSFGAKFKITDSVSPILAGLEKGHIYGRVDKPFRMNSRNVQEHDVPSYLYPLFYAEEGEVLGRFCENQLPAFVTKQCDGYTSVFCGTKLLQSEVIRNVARASGCHIYSDENDVLYANRNFVTIHAAKAGEKCIHLPKACFPYELYAERFSEYGTEIKLNMIEGETKMFALLQEKKIEL